MTWAVNEKIRVVLRRGNTLPESDANASPHPPSEEEIRRAAAILQVALLLNLGRRRSETEEPSGSVTHVPATEIEAAGCEGER